MPCGRVKPNALPICGGGGGQAKIQTGPMGDPDPTRRYGRRKQAGKEAGDAPNPYARLPCAKGPPRETKRSSTDSQPSRAAALSSVVRSSMAATPHLSVHRTVRVPRPLVRVDCLHPWKNLPMTATATATSSIGSGQGTKYLAPVA